MRKCVLIVLCFAWFSLLAQQPAKKPLSIEDFGNWNTLSGATISNDGSMVAFSQSPQKGEGVLIIYHDKGLSDSIPRGYNAAFSPENNFIAFNIKSTAEQQGEAHRTNIEFNETSYDSLGIYVLYPKQQVHKYPRVKSWEIPDENAQWIAFSIESTPPAENSELVEPDSSDHHNSGEDLVLFNIATADTIVFSEVSEWVYSRQGESVWFTRERSEPSGIHSVLYVFDTGTGSGHNVFSEKGLISNLVTDEQGKQCAFLFKEDNLDEKSWALYAGGLDGIPEKIVDEYSAGMPIGWSPDQSGNIYFSDDGTRLFFGTAESSFSEPDDAISNIDIPQVDVWSWHDEKLQSQQLVEASAESSRSYLAVYHLSHKQMVQLADPMIREVAILSGGNDDIAMGYNEQPYLREKSWTGESNRDYYIIDLNTGDKREIADCKSYVRISPHGNFVIWYDKADSGYYARSTDIQKMDAVPLTQMIPVQFFHEDHDRTNEPKPFGIAGWSEDERFVYIYDRYDIWRIDPAGERVPVCITKTYGRRNNIRLRYLRLDNSLEFLPQNEEVILSAFDEGTMSAGFYSTRFNTAREPDPLVFDSCHYSGVRMAKDAGKIIWTRETVNEFPDLWISNLNFDDAVKISDANPQQDNFIWTDVQLAEWASLSGDKIKGLLYLPENLNASRKYPVLVHLHGHNSHNLHRHHNPSPSQSDINITFYVSNGYLVLIPDVSSMEGYPGQQAYEAALSGTLYLINSFPYVDEKRIGLQGHGWGGYQTAYIISQSNLFAAAMAGAPVSNMTSAYGSIRGESGQLSMFQYERNKNSIGGTLWDKPLQFIRKSPLFYAPQINTPLLIMHNDNDGIVPRSQGIELFVALSRLDKPVWMLNYNNEPHSLTAGSWTNRIDLSTRMFQFFNHYLKDYPQPGWMETGVPVLEKGKKPDY